MQREIEIKVKISSPSDVISALLEKGATVYESVRQIDRVFLPSGRTYSELIRSDGLCVVRVRHENGINTLTAKRSISHELDCAECEVRIDNAEAAESMLNMLDYSFDVSVNKTRTRASWNNIEVCVDDVDGLGCFLELEAIVPHETDSAEIENMLLRLMEEIGALTSERIMIGYDTMMRLKRGDEL